MSYQDDNTWQLLTPKLRDQYIVKAGKKVMEDAKEAYKLAKEHNLEFPYGKLSGENEMWYIYDVAKKMWEGDGYKDLPSQFTRVSERENRCLMDLLSEDAINDLNAEMDRSFYGNFK